MLLAHTRRPLLLSLLLLALLTVLAPLGLRPSAAASPTSDLGDAPDRTNHAGISMNAYPAVPALYPVVFDAALGTPQGPLHWNPIPNGWLGQKISGEKDADLLPDADGTTNIDPAAAVANRDAYDDGIPLASTTLGLPQCAQTQFRYFVSGASAVSVPNAYVNVWFDWNRDGDWNDTLSCTTSSGAVVKVYEWAVQNQPVTIVPGTAVWSAPLFYSYHPSGPKDLWVRISLSESKPPVLTTGLADGRGPSNGYKYGETEDYLATYTGVGTTFKIQ